MRTINHWLETFKGDADLRKMIAENESVYREYKIRRRSKSSQSSRALDQIWDSVDGVYLRYELEKRGLNIDDTKAVGALKTALHLLIVELRRERGLNS